MPSSSSLVAAPAFCWAVKVQTIIPRCTGVGRTCHLIRKERIDLKKGTKLIFFSENLQPSAKLEGKAAHPVRWTA